jgi:hypothetical protein
MLKNRKKKKAQKKTMSFENIFIVTFLPSHNRKNKKLRRELKTGKKSLFYTYKNLAKVQRKTKKIWVRETCTKLQLDLKLKITMQISYNFTTTNHLHMTFHVNKNTTKTYKFITKKYEKKEHCKVNSKPS